MMRSGGVAATPNLEMRWSAALPKPNRLRRSKLMRSRGTLSCSARDDQNGWMEVTPFRLLRDATALLGVPAV
jgi:hypothetical protein